MPPSGAAYDALTCAEQSSSEHDAQDDEECSREEEDREEAGTRAGATPRRRQPSNREGRRRRPVEAYIEAMPGGKRAVARRLDALIVRTVPGVRKAVKWNSPFYGVDGQGWFLNFHTFTNYVKVAFFRGTSLRPVPPGESKHKEVRYVDIREGDASDETQMTTWIRQAAALPGWVP